MSSNHEPIEEESKEYTPSKAVIGSRDNPIINSPTNQKHNLFKQDRSESGSGNKDSAKKDQESIDQRINDIKNYYNKEAIQDMEEDEYPEINMSSKSSSF